MAMTAPMKRAFATPAARPPRATVANARQKRKAQLQLALRAKQARTVRRGGAVPSRPMYQ